MLSYAYVVLCLLSQSLAHSTVWPEPKSYDGHDGTLWISPDLKVSFSCGSAHDLRWQLTAAGLVPRNQSIFERSQQRFSELLGDWQASLGLTAGDNVGCHASSLSDNQSLRDAARRTVTSMTRTSFVPWKFHPRGSSFEPVYDARQPVLEDVHIKQQKCPDVGFDPQSFFNDDESYAVDVQDNEITVKSNSTVGTINALQTITQLVYAHSSDHGKTYMTRSELVIRDEPHWSYRGISLDIARNPFTVDDVLRTIDTMGTVKLNRLHIHATDSQSWPIDIPSLPDLARKGAYQPHLVWSAQDVAHIQHYGISRGVQVFLELDMPGHTASIAHSHPDLIAAFNQLDWNSFAAEPLSGQFMLNSSKVGDFLDTLMSDLLPRLSQYSALYHLGGDEVNRMVHLLDETVQSSDYAVLQPLIQALMQRIYTHAVENNLRPMLWEEMFLEWNLTLTSPATKTNSIKPLVQAWRSSVNIASLLKANHKVIFGDSEHWYLDCGHGVFLSPYPTGKSPPGIPHNTSGGHPTQLSPPYLDYCGPYHNWRAMYTFNPLANISEELWLGIEGGETLMWSELTDSVDLDAKLWPRAAAAAEVLWRGPRQEAMLVDATRRLAMWRERVVSDSGVRSGMVQMTWCLMEGGCEL